MRLNPTAIVALALSLTAAMLGAAAKPVYLAGPEVVKMDWGTRSLSCADIDGDGRNDLAMIDNDSGKIEILYQNNPDNPRHKARKEIKRNRWEPVLEDAPFWHDDVTMGQYGYDMALGDLNGDGRPDIIYTGNFTALTIRYQDAEGKWDKSWAYDNLNPQESTGTIVIADINGDGRNDVAILAETELLIFYQSETGTMREPKHYKLAAGRAAGIRLADINGDKLPDLMYLCGSDKYRRVSARMQQKPGEFGPEIGFPLPVGSIGLAMTHASPTPVFVSIDGQTRALLTYSIEKGTTLPTSLGTAQMRDYATGTNGKQGNLYTWGDFDGDGATDIAVANPAGAEIILFRQNADGDFDEGKPYPSFSKINSLATLRGADGRDRILVTSSGEDVAGVVEYNNQGRLTFPTPLPSDGKAVSVCAGRFTQDGRPSIALMEKRGEDYYISRFALDGAGLWQRTGSTKLNNVKRKPDSMMTAGVGHNGTDILLIFAVREAARCFDVTDGAFKEIAVNSSVRLGCTAGADASRINVCDVDGDGQKELLVGATGYARALKLTADNDFTVVDQYNSRNPDADIKGPTLICFAGDNTPHMLFFNDTDDKIELLSRDKTDGVFRSVETLDSDSQTGFSSLTLIPMGKGRADAILATGQERMGLIPLDKTGWVKKQYCPAYESELKAVGYTTLATGDLNTDGSPEIVAVDGNENLIEILEEATGESYESVMHFVVFDMNQHANPRQTPLEPRETLIADLNHDGLNDVAILVHDRVLVYTGQAAEALAK